MEMVGSYFEIRTQPRRAGWMVSFFYYLYSVPDQVGYPFKRREPTTNAIIKNHCSHIPINLSRNNADAMLLTRPQQIPTTNLVLPYNNIITYTQKRNHPNPNPRNAPPLAPLSALCLKRNNSTTSPAASLHQQRH